MADAGPGDQSGGTSHLISGLFEVGAATCGIAGDSLPVPARMAAIHFRNFSFSAPTNAALPRILKKDVPSSDAIAPIIRPSLLAAPSSGFPPRSTTSTSPRAVGNFLNISVSFSGSTGGLTTRPKHRLHLLRTLPASQ